MITNPKSKIFFTVIIFAVCFSTILYNNSVSAFSPTGVSIQSGKLLINGTEFFIRGVNYNPVPIGSDQIDATATVTDVPKIAQLKANTIGTYNAGQFEWGQWSNLSTGENFYSNLYPVAEQYNLKIIVGYFSNQTVDWTDTARVERITSQYQALITRAKSRPSTLLYLIGNEVFEVLPNDIQRTAYAQWIGQMVEWTHQVDPEHPVTYADNALHSGLPWLKQYAPKLDIYSLNNYEWSTPSDLSSILSYDSNAWPGKPLLLHEWGVDSFNVNNWSENESSQANKIVSLAGSIEQIHNQNTTPFLGSLLFEYTDQWDKVGSNATQDPDQGWPWACNTCFDGKANQDYWGITRSTNSGQSRTFKQGYYALQSFWNGTKTPIPSATSRPKKPRS